MASLKGTKTEQNLLKAFAGESQARNRYTYAASVAKKEGYEQIAAIFLEGVVGSNGVIVLQMIIGQELEQFVINTEFF